MTKRKIICILVLTMLMTISLPASGSGKFSLEHISEPTDFGIDEKGCNAFLTNVLVRIDTTDGYIPLPGGVEVLGGKPNKWIDIIIPRTELCDLSNTGIDYSILIWDVDSYSRSFAEQYHTLAEMEQILQDIADEYPDITSLYSLGTTYEGRDIWCLEITDNPGVDEREPGVFYMGLHHAREWPTLEICLHIADNLTSNYGSHSNITDVVNNRRLWLVPCVNPDGYYYCHDLGNDWRKNRHYFPDFGVFGTWGVDLNRNYGGSSNGDAWGSWGSLGPASVSHMPLSEVYCGPSTLSELETQAIRNVFLKNDICAGITWHTFSELVMWPWGYSADAKTPDNEYMAHVGTEIASRITNQNGNGNYTPTQSAGLYPTTGDTTDWAYGYGHYVQGRPTFVYTIEACSSFHPPENRLEQICKENFDGALYLLQEAENISNVVPRVIPPIIDEMSADSDGNYTIHWQEQNPDVKSEYFQLDEVSDLSIIFDNAESGSDLWTLDGFSITDSKCHSSINSFKSRKTDVDVCSMTTNYPIPVMNGMSLSFWCWYDTNKNDDYAFVEVSRDGRYYQILDEFTSSSNGWIFREYDLDEFADDSVFVRFRYTTGTGIPGNGFYVDDISPVADFGSITILSNSITENHYEVIDMPEGIYYYRVRGRNSEHGWGDFSTLERINVAVENNEPPNKPAITGPTSGKVGESYTYSAFTTDPNEDQLYYLFDWGDGGFSGWIGPYESGQTGEVSHKWEKKGAYEIRVKARDEYNVESEWSDPIPLTIPKNKAIDTPFLSFLERLLYRFPFLR